MSAVMALWHRWQASHAGRSWQRYGDARGSVMAGGVAYLGFFSLVPALVLGFTVFGIVLRRQPELFARVVASISETLPGVVRDAAHPKGLIDASHPPTPNALTVTGAISLVTLLLGGLGWAGALREGVRAMFDQPTLQVNWFKARARDLGVLATLGLAVLVSGVLSTVVNAAGPWLLRVSGVGEGSLLGSTLLRLAAIAVVFAVDVVTLIIVLRLLSGLDLPRGDVLQAALIGAAGLGLLKLTSGLLLKSATNKPLLASFAVIIGLLVLINLISRVILLASAWAATEAHDRGRLEGGAVPAAAASGLPVGPRESVLPTFGQRAGDRTTVAAGAVLGVSAVVGAQTVRRGVRAAVDAVRGR